MATFQPMAYPNYVQVPYSKQGAYSSRASSLALSSSDIVGLNHQNDLLPGLWNPSITPTTSIDDMSSGKSAMWDATDDQEYAKSLLPNSLHDFLPPLTEENLHNSTLNYQYSDRKSSVSENSEELFQFEKPTPTPPQLTRKRSTSSAKHHHHHHHHHSAPSTSPKNVNTSLYKTELCASFIKVGICPYGNKCQFAHGENELKRVERPPKWRSKPCVNWARYGSCRYGNRCCFKHEN